MGDQGFYDAMGGLGPRPQPVKTPPFRLPTDMAGPEPPRGSPIVQMQPGGAQYAEDFYAPDMALRRQADAMAGGAFIDRIEDNGVAVVVEPGPGGDWKNYTTRNVPAQPGWQEGMQLGEAMPIRGASAPSSTPVEKRSAGANSMPVEQHPKDRQRMMKRFTDQDARLLREMSGGRKRRAVP